MLFPYPFQKAIESTPSSELTAGVITTPTVISATELSASATAATGATGAVSYQWHISITSGFTPDGTTAIAGATTFGSVLISDLSFFTTYYLKLVATDDNGSVTYAQVSAKTKNRFTVAVIGAGGGVDISATIDLAHA